MSDDLRLKTIQTYDKSAKQLADYFGNYSRTPYIRRVFELIGNPKDALVVEIGCGNGRDAKEILKHTSNYIGFDPSAGLLEIAKKISPRATFKLSDAVSFEYPDEIEAVFAFASLLHVDINEMRVVFDVLREKMKAGGVFYLSLKYSDNYQAEIKTDHHGERLFYLYNSEIIQNIAGKEFEVVSVEENIPHGMSKNTWLEMILRKIS